MFSTTPAKRGSLAARLTLWFSLSTFALVLGATGYLYWALARNMDREDDWALADQIRILRVLLREQPEHSAGIKQGVELESRVREQSRMYVRILDEQRRLVAESPGMARRLPIEFFEEPREGRSGISRRSGGRSYPGDLGLGGAGRSGERPHPPGGAGPRRG